MAREKIFKALERLDAAIAKATAAVCPPVVLLHFRNSPDRCFYCGILLTDSDATLDHIKPRSKGGTRSPGNIVPACSRCNGIKGSKSVASPKFRCHFPDGRFWAESRYGVNLLPFVLICVPASSCLIGYFR